MWVCGFVGFYRTTFMLSTNWRDVSRRIQSVKEYKIYISTTTTDQRELSASAHLSLVSVKVCSTPVSLDASIAGTTAPT